MYCGSLSHGRPCIFSPTNTHVHLGDSEKCIYCGSKSLGSGCLFNPYSKFHVRGPEFLNRIKEQTEKTILLKTLIENLNVQNDLNYSSPLDRFYKRLVSIISDIGQPLLEALNLSEKPVYKDISKKDFCDIMKLKNNFEKNLLNFQNILKEANLKFPKELVEDILLDAIISNNEKLGNSKKQ